MRRLVRLALLATTLVAAPAFAEAEKIKPEDITKQETVALGGNRFLIFSGTAGDHKHYGYTVDLVKLDDGVPHFDPLFMEEYVADANASKLAYGVAFFALNYRFDKGDNTLDYTAIDPDDETRYQYKYKLDNDIFKLQEVITQGKPSCAEEPCKPPPPKVVFNAKDIKSTVAEADKAAEAADAKPAAKGPDKKDEKKEPEKKASNPFIIAPPNSDKPNDTSTENDTKTH